MKSQFRSLIGLAAAALAVAADSDCIDCEATLVANPGWFNGILAQGNYINPTKTDNWHLWTALNDQGQLEVRNDPAGGNYVWNFRPKTHDGLCRVYMNQVITVQAGVTYDFAIQYSLTGVRANAGNTLHLYVETLPEKRLVFSPYTVALNTDGWATFKPSPWTAPASGDIICTLHWVNDPNDATVLIKSVSMTRVECRNPASTKTCSLESEPAATTTSTTTTSTSTVELDPTTTFTASDIQSTTTTSSELESSTSTTSATSSSTSLAPIRSCKRKRRNATQPAPPLSRSTL